jgi:hypothetical protein
MVLPTIALERGKSIRPREVKDADLTFFIEDCDLACRFRDPASNPIDDSTL